MRRLSLTILALTLTACGSQPVAPSLDDATDVAIAIPADRFGAQVHDDAARESLAGELAAVPGLDLRNVSLVRGSHEAVHGAIEGSRADRLLMGHLEYRLSDDYLTLSATLLVHGYARSLEADGSISQERVHDRTIGLNTQMFADRAVAARVGALHTAAERSRFLAGEGQPHMERALLTLNGELFDRLRRDLSETRSLSDD